MLPLNLTESSDGVRLPVRVKPKASRTAIVGIVEGNLVVSLAAPPVDGEANLALTKAVAKWLGLSSRSVTIAYGDKSKTKLLAIAGLTAEDLESRLIPLCPGLPTSNQ